jgi:DNA-binding response OmpR family regulator
LEGGGPVPKPVTIAVIDDDEPIVDVVASYLQKNGYKVVTATTGGKALDLIETHNPALVILDRMLPDVSGEELCQAIRKRSRMPILMLTAKVREDDILEGLALGADDYMTKPFSPRELMARVDALLRRASRDPVPLYSRISFNKGELVLDVRARELRKGGVRVALTPDEFNILMALLQYPKKVFTREELIRQALDDEFDGFDRIIDTHVKNLRQKIETDPRHPGIILTVHGVGYKFGGELDED